jgi:hypothetical protein
MRTKNPAGLLVTLARALGWLDAPGTAVRSRFRLYAFARERRDNMLRMDDAKLVSWIEWGQIFDTFLVASGVAGEFAGTFMARPVQRRLDAKRELELAQLRKDAAAAELRAAELEAIIQPGYLTKSQADAITASMRPFCGSRDDHRVALHRCGGGATRRADQGGPHFVGGRRVIS